MVNFEENKKVCIDFQEVFKVEIYILQGIFLA